MSLFSPLLPRDMLILFFLNVRQEILFPWDIIVKTEVLAQCLSLFTSGLCVSSHVVRTSFWVVTIYLNQPAGNLVHKHKTINFEMVGARAATKYIEISRNRQKRGGNWRASNHSPRSLKLLPKRNGTNYLIFQAGFSVFPCKWQFSRPSVLSTTWFVSESHDTTTNQRRGCFFPWANRSRVSTSNVCLPLDMGLGTKPEQDCRSFTKYEAEICCLHLSHPSPLLFSISHPSCLTTSNRGGNRDLEALGKKVGPSLFKNLCQYYSNMADVVALVAPSDAILSPLFHMLFLYRST